MKIDLRQADNSSFLGVNHPCPKWCHNDPSVIHGLNTIKASENKNAIGIFAIQTPQHVIDHRKKSVMKALPRYVKQGFIQIAISQIEHLIADAFNIAHIRAGKS